MNNSHWVEPSAEYRHAYEQAIADSVVLGEDLRRKISPPIPVLAKDAYFGRHPLMIAGQETFGVNDPLASVSYGKAFEYYAKQVADFNYAQGLEGAPYASPFWTAYGTVCSELGLASPWGALFSNVVKVQAISDGSRSILIQLDPGERVKVLDWQRQLFNAELEAYRPKRVLAFTGPRYDWIWQRMIPDLSWENVGGTPANWLRTATSARWNLRMVRTYHPQYFLQRNPARAHLLDDAITLLREIS